MINTLVVSGGGYQGLTLIKGLRYSNSVRIIMVDSSDENVSKYFVDAFYVIPKISKENQFIRSLLEICKKEHIQLIFPSTNIELSVLSRNKDIFMQNNIYVAVSDMLILSTIMNKRSLYEFLKKNKFPALPIVDISDKHLEFPIIGKPFDSWGSKGIITLSSFEDLQKWNLPELKANYVWQPLLDGFEEFSIDSAINFDGELCELSIRRRIKTLGGFAAITENADNTVIEKIVRSFLQTLSLQGGTGIFNVQILKKGNNYYISDVNPRIGTSAVFSYQK